MTTIAIQRSRPRWQPCLLLAAMLAGVAMLASGSPMPEPTLRPSQISTWRRTRDGWEQPRWLAPKLPPRAIALHPIYVAALTILLTAMALVGHRLPVNNPN